MAIIVTAFVTFHYNQDTNDFQDKPREPTPINDKNTRGKYEWNSFRKLNLTSCHTNRQTDMTSTTTKILCVNQLVIHVPKHFIHYHCFTVIYFLVVVQKETGSNHESIHFQTKREEKVLGEDQRQQRRDEIKSCDNNIILDIKIIENKEAF